MTKKGTGNKYKNCTVVGCQRLIYAKGVCRAHRDMLLRRGTTEKYKPPMENRTCPICLDKFNILKCKKQKTCGKESCKWEHFRGANNHRWSGGKFLYKDHYLMKNNRKIKLQLTNNRCEKCGEPANTVHHIDGGKTDHSLGNLMVVCTACHWDIHRGEAKKTSKFKRECGYSLKDIFKMGINYRVCKTLLKEGRLKEFVGRDESGRREMLRDITGKDRDNNMARKSTKNLKLEDDVHDMLKEYCRKNDKKIYKFGNTIIRNDLLKRRLDRPVKVSV